LIQLGVLLPKHELLEGGHRRHRHAIAEFPQTAANGYNPAAAMFDGAEAVRWKSPLLRRPTGSSLTPND
jgi:hypothetical protein